MKAIVYCALRAKTGVCARYSHTILSDSGTKASFGVLKYTKRVWNNWCSVGRYMLSVNFLSQMEMGEFIKLINCYIWYFMNSATYATTSFVVIWMFSIFLPLQSSNRFVSLLPSGAKTRVFALPVPEISQKTWTHLFNFRKTWAECCSGHQMFKSETQEDHSHFICF